MRKESIFDKKGKHLKKKKPSDFWINNKYLTGTYTKTFFTVGLKHTLSLSTKAASIEATAVHTCYPSIWGVEEGG